jgi:hypothetical protein
MQSLVGVGPGLSAKYSFARVVRFFVCALDETGIGRRSLRTSKSPVVGLKRRASPLAAISWNSERQLRKEYAGWIPGI